MSATLHAWAAAGSSPPPYDAAPAAGHCATCGTETTAGVSLDQIETPTTSGHADLFRFGSQHVCPGCAWLFAAGKGRPGNYIAYGQRLEYTVISLESVVDDKRPWLEVLRDVAALPAQTPIAGVMTTDVKPRLWHRARLASVGQFGLLIHAPDYDVSEWRSFDLAECLSIVDAMLPALHAGFAKQSLYFGLLRDYARASRQLDQAIAWEKTLRPLAASPAFLPALIAAGTTKDQKHDIKPIARPAANPQPAPAIGDQPAKAQLGLF